MLKTDFMVALQAVNLQLCQKINHTTSIFQLISPPSKNTCFKENFKGKSNNFKMQCIVCYLRCIVLHFRLLSLASLTDRGSTFYEIKMNRLMGQHLRSSAINKTKGKHGKYRVKLHSLKYIT